MRHDGYRGNQGTELSAPCTGCLVVDSYRLNLSLLTYKMETCPLHWDNVYRANIVQYLAHSKGAIGQLYWAAAICLWAAPDHILSLLRRLFVPFILLY